MEAAAARLAGQLLLSTIVQRDGRNYRDSPGREGTTADQGIEMHAIASCIAQVYRI